MKIKINKEIQDTIVIGGSGSGTQPFLMSKYFYAPVVKVGKFNTYQEGTGVLFPPKKGTYVLSVSRDVSVKINGKIYDFVLSATDKTLQDIADLKVGDEVMCYVRKNKYKISDDLVKYKVKKSNIRNNEQETLPMDVAHLYEAYKALCDYVDFKTPTGCNDCPRRRFCTSFTGIAFKESLDRIEKFIKTN